MQRQRSASDWHREALLAYHEKHQGCAWCGGTYCVRQSRHGAKQVLSCQRCDFQVSRDLQSERCNLIPGEDMTAVSETMIEQSLADLLQS